MAFLSKINDVSGGDITSIVSSTGLSGGATSGVVTLSVDAQYLELNSHDQKSQLQTFIILVLEKKASL